MSTSTYVERIQELDYDIFLLDMWGVMHNGSTPYDHVLDTIQGLKKAGKTMIILSNSSKRTEDSIRSLQKLGFEPSDFEQIITSGEVSYRMLRGDDSLDCETWSVLSDIRRTAQTPKVFVLGSGAADEEYCTSCGWTCAPLAQADLILARGTFAIFDGSGTTVDKHDSEDEYNRILQESLQEGAARKVPMLVSNPDKVRPDEGLPPMPGAIGDAYELLLGDDAERLVKRIGKPFPEVFEIALKGKDPSKACMVGDALETDVSGGTNMGIATVWSVMDGIHGPDIREMATLQEGTMAVLDAFNRKDGTYAKHKKLQPTYIIPSFRW